MHRAAARNLKGIVPGRVHASYATSAALPAQKSSGGLFSWLTGEHSKSCPPLDFPLPGVILPPPIPDFVSPSQTRITTLPNAFKIASQAAQSPAASIGIYVDSGSIYETPITSGASHLLERMAFKSTANRSHLRIVREVEAIGGHVQASASREQMGYTFDALKTYLPHMVEILVDCVRNPVFLDWEINETKLKAEIADASKDPPNLLLEAVHCAGYSGALANPLLAPESAIDKLNGSLLEDYIAEHYTAPRMVLAAYGVDHEDLVSIAEPLLSDLPNVPHPGEPNSVYVGGDYRCQADSGMTHFALAFELPGGWRNQKDAMVLSVLQMLMGGGGSFSAGGPGKGMHSRLYLNVLNQHGEIQSFTAFTSVCNSSGLFGIQGSTGSDYASKAIDIAVAELVSIATPGKVSQPEVDRAKQATKSAILMHLESRMVASEDIGRQILTYGERKPVDDYLKIIDAVTPKDITSIAQKLLASPLTMASHGDVRYVPSYESVSSKFH
uniref:Mitochondrial-processing peptidase subunit alpha n=1 Tax=Kalanchoe fedtschenkoi TaxID=63787 RepID=A0A7N0UV31_KALFE